MQARTRFGFYLTPEKTRFHYVDSAKASYTNRTDLVGTISFWNNDFFQKAKRIVKFNVTPEGKAIFYSKVIIVFYNSKIEIIFAN